MKRRDTTDIVADVFLGLVVITIVVLKLTNIIKLSWFWLLAPIWICLIFGMFITLILIVMGFIQGLIDKKEKKYERN